MANENAESLHDKANTRKGVDSKFVSPGTPDRPLISPDQMPQAKQDKGTQALRDNLNKA